MNAFIFPGQGSQHPGMGLGLCERHVLAKELFRSADEILGYPISEIMFHGTEEQLKQTKHTQLAMFLHGYIAYKCLNISMPDMVAGHSLGEYTALTAAGCLQFEDALRLVEIRANAMQKACELEPSGMAVVLKFDEKTIEEVCASVTEEVVVPANYNSQQQLVISGSLKGLEIAIERLKEAGAKRIMMLNVGGAFHSPLMQTAQDELAEAICLPECQCTADHRSRHHPREPRQAAHLARALDADRAQHGERWRGAVHGIRPRTHPRQPRQTHRPRNRDRMPRRRRYGQLNTSI